MRRWDGSAVGGPCSPPGPCALAAGSASRPYQTQYLASARVYIDADAVLTPLLRGITVDSSLTDEIDLLQQMMLSRPNLERIIAKTDLQLDASTRTDLEQMVESLSKSIKVVPVSRNIFTITYRNHDKQLSYDVVQAVLASFIENKAGDNRDEMEKATAFLDSQIDSYEKQLRSAENLRADFRRKYVDLLPGDNGVNRLEQARVSVRSLTGDLADARTRRVLLARELGGTPQLVVTDAGVVGDTNSSLRAAQNKLRELQQIYTDQYPDVITAKHEVEVLRHSAPTGGGGTGSRSAPNPLYEQLKLRVVETDAQIDSLQRQVDDAVHERDRLDSIARGAPGLEAQYLNLNRDYDVLRKNYDELISRREGMRIATKAQVSSSNVKMVIIDTPQVPQDARGAGSHPAFARRAGARHRRRRRRRGRDRHAGHELPQPGCSYVRWACLSSAAFRSRHCHPPLGSGVRKAAVFGGAMAGLLVVLGGVLLHYSLQS